MAGLRRSPYHRGMEYTLKLRHMLALSPSGDGISQSTFAAADDEAAVAHADTAFGQSIADSEQAELVNEDGVVIRTWGGPLAQGS
jgi:hypothetical protein